MHDTTTIETRTFGTTGPANVRVWDPLVRIFHWSLATCFAVAYLTEDDLLTLHVWAGYTVLGLIAVRFVWGVVGPRYARWSDFVKPPHAILAYLRDTIRLRAARHFGHNPAAGAMVVALLASLTLTGLSGVALFGAQELSGPLGSVMSGTPKAWAHVLEDVHEILANLTLLLVFVHVVGVALASMLHRENLVKAMFTGEKRREAS